MAHRTLDQAGTSLGRAIANALNLIDIDLVILGGDLAHLLPHVEKLLYSEVSYRMLGSRWVETELVADTHGARTAVLGARHASFEDFVENP
ncbi:ROK family protein [Trueperella pyogenes]|uniref:ROK family protein n=1 Tax=Trueperella pyogenes TaxID=1661 RepID=UPI000E1C18B2|nr:ROK family protein [Trueperella pyogenes]